MSLSENAVTRVSPTNWSVKAASARYRVTQPPHLRPHLPPLPLILKSVARAREERANSICGWGQRQCIITGTDAGTDYADEEDVEVREPSPPASPKPTRGRGRGTRGRGVGRGRGARALTRGAMKMWATASRGMVRGHIHVHCLTICP
ncbi:hypothetical protein F5887DRAFT_39696 [Amanita rubescens]|nr:hypothetical protein F5887DRAFT_39696 [Amanita rubescens]